MKATIPQMITVLRNICEFYPLTDWEQGGQVGNQGEKQVVRQVIELLREVEGGKRA